MPDIVDEATRSRMMSGIRGKDTRPEMVVRRGLHAMGFRYKLHDGTLPGKPDLVFPARRAVILVNGCFWHGHDCHLFKWPSSRADFWKRKILRNREKDAETLESLCSDGWRILTVWECALKGSTRLSASEVVRKVARWLQSGRDSDEIRGTDGDGSSG